MLATPEGLLSKTFRAVVETLVPEAERLSSEEWARLSSIVEGFLQDRPAALRRQLALLLWAIDMLSLLRHGRRLASLDQERRIRLLKGLEDAPLLLIRRGLWGLRTIAFLGYYARPGANREIGYQADPRGWEARG